MKKAMMRAAIFAAMCIAGAASAHTDAPHGKPAASNEPQMRTIAPHAGKAGAGGTRDARTYFTDLELQTQDARRVRFYSDVLEGKTVLINVIYTNCKDACPMITQQLLDVRKRLPEAVQKQVHFVTITSDPKRDTPKALKAFARKQSADVEGWTFLTGSKDNVDHILKKLGQFSEHIEGHSTLLIGGNVPAKRWSKIRADAPPHAIVARMTELAAASGSAPAEAQ